MKTVTEHLYDHFYSSYGFYSLPSIEELKESEWSEEYEQLRHNRMVMGAFRYGQIKYQPLGKFDHSKEAKRRIDLYDQTHNLEHLLDAGNIIMLGFIEAKKLGHHLFSIDDGTHNPIRKE